jgi:hypothetical protein
MQQPPQERRTMRRFDMRLPAAVTIAGENNELLTETQNVSARGVYFFLSQPIEPGTRVLVTMTFPPHITLTDPVRVRFTARVLRVESQAAGARMGVAALIEDYEFLKSTGTDIFSGLPKSGTES